MTYILCKSNTTDPSSVQLFFLIVKVSISDCATHYYLVTMMKKPERKAERKKGFLLRGDLTPGTLISLSSCYNQMDQQSRPLASCSDIVLYTGFTFHYYTNTEWTGGDSHSGSARSVPCSHFMSLI